MKSETWLQKLEKEYEINMKERSIETYYNIFKLKKEINLPHSTAVNKMDAQSLAGIQTAKWDKKEKENKRKRRLRG